MKRTHSLVEGAHRARIPFSHVVEIGPRVKVALRDRELASHDAERWARRPRDLPHPRLPAPPTGVTR